LYGRDLTVPIQLTDTLPPTISVTAAQATQDATVLNQISTTFLLSVGGTAEQLDGLTIALAANEKVELAITSLDHDITVTGSIFDVDLAKLAVANDTVTISSYASCGQTGTEIDLTGTDGLMHKIISSATIRIRSMCTIPWTLALVPVRTARKQRTGSQLLRHWRAPARKPSLTQPPMSRPISMRSRAL
jgi:hypothetical protein